MKKALLLTAHPTGQTVQSTDSHFNRIMSIDVAPRLNLKAHYCGLRDPKRLFSAADIEGHIGDDGKYYLLGLLSLILVFLVLFLVFNNNSRFFENDASCPPRTRKISQWAFIQPFQARICAKIPPKTLFRCLFR